MPDNLSAIDLRRWAARCADLAQTNGCAEERERLARMSDAILSLADNADWLAGAPDRHAGAPAK